jgi:3-oxoacid CoA-transferase subunit A
MIKNWIVTGDTHGWVETRLSNIYKNMPEYRPEETAVIILGDAGLNFWLNKTDKKHKRLSSAFGYTIYCVRGNHEERPQKVPGIHPFFDENVNGIVFQEMDYPNIRYFQDGGEYTIDGHSTLVIGGAYSIDKWYRLKRAELAGQSFSGWFESEQLTHQEMKDIFDKVRGKTYDLILTHTTALDWEPVDLFLNGIDQSTVDKSMEVWLNELKDVIAWKIWLFGHYHADRVERPYVEQFYGEYEPLTTIWERWQKYNETKTLDWWIPKSPVMEDILNGETT